MKLLVIDDDPQIRELLKATFSKHEVLEAPDGARGLALACTARPDLILLDRQMPHLDGLEALRTLQETPATAAIPVIILSALGKVEDRIAGLTAGATDYLAKPFDVKELLARVEAALRQVRRWKGAASGGEADSDSAETLEHSGVYPGKTLEGKYHLRRLLGEGGMATVYLANHSLLGQPVAVKLIRPSRASSRRAQGRFMREAKIAMGLRHPNVVTVRDFGRSKDGLLYLVMDYVEGETLRELSYRERPMPPKRAVELVSQLLEGLGAVHAQGIAHRDVKPSNALIDRDQVLHLLDFGLAKNVIEESGPELTSDGAAVGTPLYMSPEQARREPCDHRSDIYSTGAVLYELLTGSPPFGGDTSVDAMQRHLEDTPKAPSELAPTAGPLDRVVLKALRKEPNQRWATAKDFKRALESALEDFEG